MRTRSLAQDPFPVGQRVRSRCRDLPRVSGVVVGYHPDGEDSDIGHVVVQFDGPRQTVITRCHAFELEAVPDTALAEVRVDPEAPAALRRVLWLLVVCMVGGALMFILAADPTDRFVGFIVAIASGLVVLLARVAIYWEAGGR